MKSKYIQRNINVPHYTQRIQNVPHIIDIRLSTSMHNKNVCGIYLFFLSRKFRLVVRYLPPKQ